MTTKHEPEVAPMQDQDAGAHNAAWTVARTILGACWRIFVVALGLAGDVVKLALYFFATLERAAYLSWNLTRARAWKARPVPKKPKLMKLRYLGGGRQRKR